MNYQLHCRRKYSGAKCLFLLALIGFCSGTLPMGVLAQKATTTSSARAVSQAQNEKDKTLKKKKAKLPPENLAGAMLAAAQFNFTLSGLAGATLSNPTSLQFGPDGRLYVAQQNGLIKAFTVVRNASNTYAVTATETISLINQIPNHNDDGSLSPTVTIRQITGILVKGTATRPILYVSSSDSRIGGPNGDLNLDTNSGIISLLSWTGSVWTKMDLVRGLPRSEENHSTNGLQLDDQTNTLYVAQGGHTNAGSPSINFAYTTEYALSAAILSVNLTTINALPTKGSGNAAYKYDLPTLNDPDRTNNPDGSDPFDPFGGNDGLNQARLDPAGPVRMFSPGYRNPYDLVLTKGRKMYTIDNGANQGWGGYPANEGTANATNNYVAGEPGSTSPTATEGTVNNLDNLHYIGNLSIYTPGSYYGGHPAPTRANPAGAGLYTRNGSTGVWRTSKTGAQPLPADWPPVATANAIEGDYQSPGSAKSKALLTFTASTNGTAEYTASNFNGALKGTLLACSYDGNVVKISLTADGTNVTNLLNPQNKVNQDLPFASNFGATPLDIVAQGDADVFPGTVWAATYGANAITVFEPQDFLRCTGLYNTADDDLDGYTNADEIDNASQPCSAASLPPDADHDFVSDLNDNDDDNDGLADTTDFFPLDATNGLTTTLPIKYDLFNNSPGTGLFGVGFTGLMSNKDSVYSDLFFEDNLIAGGAVGAFSIVNVSPGDALGVLDTQEDAFQFGVKAASAPFTVQSRLLGPFFNSKTPQNFQSQGIYLSNGDQDNYVKVALTANGGVGGLEVVYENAGVPVSTTFLLPGGIPSSTLDFFFAVNPATGAVQPKYSVNGGAVITLGSPVLVTGALLAALQTGKAYAVGIMATSRNATPFTATWDFIHVTADVTAVTGSWQIVPPTTGTFTGREEDAYVAAGDKFYLLGGRGIVPVQEYNPATKSWSNKIAPPIEINHFQAVTLDGLIYVAGAMNGAFPHEVPVPNVYVFNPASNKWSVGASIPPARRRGAAGAVVYKNKIYLVAGITDGHWAGWVPWFDEYDPATNTWKTLPNAPRPRDHFNATLIDDKLYLVGGRRSSASTSQTFDLTIPEVDVYDFTAGTWSTLPSGSNLPTPRAGAANVLLGNELVIIGGESSQAAGHKETHALNVTTNTWRRVADLQGSRHGTQAIVNNSGIYIAAGAGNQGGGPLVLSQEAFYLSSPTTPTGTALSQSQLTADANLSYGPTAPNSSTTKTLTLTNTGGNQAILVSAIAISGATSFSYTAPFTLPFIVPVGATVDLTVQFNPTASGTQSADLVVTHSGQNGTTTTALSGGSGTETPLYRLNSGGGQVVNSIGTFAADKFFSPTPGIVFSTGSAIAGTTDDAIYQSERFGSTFGYSFAVSSGQQYKVVLHFAELYWTSAGKRVFDVSIEGNKVLDNYDIFKKVSSLTATTETFTVAVADDVLNINFSALASEGGVDNAKVSAIEIYTISSNGNQAPTATAGLNQSITLPTNSVTLNGSGSDPDGTISAFTWTQVSGPNTAAFSSKTVAGPTLSGLVAGSYVLSLVVTDNGGLSSAASSVTITVNPATTGAVAYRLNAGGGALSTSTGPFAADAYFTNSSGGVYSAAYPIAGTSDDALYQTERFGTFTYALPVSNGQYTVVLHFAELYWTAAGQRVFDVAAEGTKVLLRYDIVKKVGTKTATTETFPVSVTDGVLTLSFSALASAGGVDLPKVSAIEVLTSSTTNQAPTATAGPNQSITLPTNSVTLNGSGSDPDGTISAFTWTQVSGPNTAAFSSKTVAAPTVGGLVAGSYVLSLVVTDNGGLSSAASSVTITVNPATTGAVAYRLNAGGGALSTSTGPFAADAYFTNSSGGVYSAAYPIAGTSDDALYQTERFGTFAYALPVSNGQYTVVLHFAELYWTAAGQRVFDVAAEGTKVLLRYDIVKKVGTKTATTETFPVSVTDGVLTLSFSALASAGGVDLPKVSAIEVLAATAIRTASTPPAVLSKGEVPIFTSLIKAYPNPSENGRFSIMLPEAFQGEISYTLVSSLGAQVTTGKRTLPASNSLVNFDFSQQMPARGIYYLHLKGKKAQAHLKLMRE